MQVIVLIKDEEPTGHSIKQEEETSNVNETSLDSEPPSSPAKVEKVIDSTASKYKGRGRPRKGQEVKKQKRVPKPQPLEMCQICGQLFKCIKTHMFVHDTQPQFECHHCGRSQTANYVKNFSPNASSVLSISRQKV